MAIFTLDFLQSGCPLSPPAELAPALRLGLLQAALASLSLIPVFSVYVVFFNFLGAKGRFRKREEEHYKLSTGLGPQAEVFNLWKGPLGTNMIVVH